MSYSLINGAPINGAEGTADRVINLAGLELVTAGGAEGEAAASAQSATPIEFGALAAKFPIAPAGADLVQSGTHTGLFNVLIQPSGLDLVTAGISSAWLTADAQSARPLEFGAVRARNGVDVQIIPDGADLVRTGLIAALPDQPPGYLVCDVISVRPLEMGALDPVLVSIAVDAAGSQPLELGNLATGRAVFAQGSQPLEVGGAGTSLTIDAIGAQPMELASVGMRFRMALAGMPLGRTSTHSASLREAEADVDSAQPLEMGELKPFGVAVYAHTSFPLKFGAVQLNRGTTC